MKTRTSMPAVLLVALALVCTLASPPRGAAQSCVTITCPADTVVSGTNSMPVSYPMPTATNHCGGSITNVVVICTPAPGQPFPSGTTLVTCVATVGTSSTNTCSFHVTVGLIPAISIQPESSAVTNGGLAIFSIAGPPSNWLSYQWHLNGLPVPGATGATLVIPAVGPEHVGNYSLIASNATGLAISPAARLTMLAPALIGPLIRAGSVWKYLFNGNAPPTDWRSPAFNDAPWNTGAAELGFGDGDEGTVIGSSASGFITAYFRRPFTVDMPQSASNLVLSLRRDDGAIVYLNETEIFRSNMPGGTVDHLTLAASPDANEGLVVYSTAVDSAVLREGLNLLAVEVHQWSAGSSDLSYELSLTSCGNGSAMSIAAVGQQVVVSWTSSCHRLQGANVLPAPGSAGGWIDLPNASPASFLQSSSPHRFFRLICR